MKSITPFKAHMYVLLATFLVAGSFIASEKLAQAVNPFSLTLYRFFFSLILLSPFVIFRSSFRAKIISTMPRALIISFFYSLYFMALFESLKSTTVLNTGTLYTLVPLITAILALFVFKETIGLKKLLVYLVGLIGTLWVVFKADIDLMLSFTLNSGDYIFMLGALSMCCYSVSLKLLYRDDNPIVLVFCTLIGGSLWMFLAIMILNEPLNWDKIEGELFYHMAYLIVGTTIVTLFIYQKTTIVLGPTKVMSYIYLNPVAVAVLAYTINVQNIQAVVIPGIIISAMATIILQKS